MKRLLSTLVLAAVCGFASAQAGTTTQVDYTKQIETPIVESRIGVGFYAAVFGGANVHQRAEFGDLEAGDIDVDVDLDSETGWFAGLKLGYVFDTGSFLLPAIELEGFYNNVDVNLHAEADDFDVTSEIGGELDQIVVQLNFQLKFDCGRFRPYIGAGAGAAYLESDEIRGEVRLDGDEFFDFEGDVDDFGINNEGWVFAWQGLAGFDFYFTDNCSVFAEYKALFFHGNDDEIDYYLQHLVGGGIRFHF